MQVKGKVGAGNNLIAGKQNKLKKKKTTTANRKARNSALGVPH